MSRWKYLDKNKKLLIAGIIGFSLVCAIAVLFEFSDIEFLLLVIAAWLLWYAYCVYIVMRSRGKRVGLKQVPRFIISSAIAQVIVCWSPWAGIPVLSAYATDYVGVFIVASLSVFVAVACFSLTLFFVVFLTTKSTPGFNALWFIRLLLIVVAVSITGTISGILLMQLSSAISVFDTPLLSFVEVLISQLLYGFAYYYVITSLMPKDANENALQPKSH